MFTGPSFHSSLSDGPIHRDRYHLKIRSKNVFSLLHCLWKSRLQKMTLKVVKGAMS